MIKIDKSIPLPPRSHVGGRTPKYPWKDMKVGDSFFVPVSQRSIGATAYSASKRLKRTFVTRQITAKTTRVWRTS